MIATNMFRGCKVMLEEPWLCSVMVWRKIFVVQDTENNPVC